MSNERPSAEDLHLRPIVGGLSVDHGDSELPVFDPSTGATVTSVPDVGATGANAAVRSARDAMDAWAGLAPRDRAIFLLKLADAVEAHTDELSALEALDVGKPLHMVPAEIASSVDKLRFFAGGARIMSAPAANEYRPPYTSFVRRDPVGVVAALAPWNYPLAMAVWKIGPALAAGNTVVLKPSPETPLSSLKLAELAAGIFPPGVINVVTGGAAVGEALVTNPDVGMISLTGGTVTGKVVMRAAAEGVKPLHLELGGNAAMLIFDDADLDRLRSMYFMAAFRNSGQDCHAASRVYTTPGMLDRVTDVIADVARSTVVGDAFHTDTAMGPLVSDRQVKQVSGLVDRALARAGVEVVTGNQQRPGDGYFLEPTVLRGANHTDEIVQAEIFGPAVTIGTFQSEAEAIYLANGVSQGLAASVWTGSIDQAMRVSKALRVGTVWVNSHGATVAEMPFGGVKESGFGRDLSVMAIEQHTTLKHIAVYTDLEC